MSQVVQLSRRPGSLPACQSSRPGLLLVNLGTPDAPTTADVRRYLREFLSDPRVIDIPAPLRWLLLNLIILPLRPARSAEAYRKVWTDEGSPLLVHSQRLQQQVQQALPGVQVELGMRYGKPSLADALARLEQAGCGELTVFPLYPQFASSTTGSTLEAIYRQLAGRWNTPSVRVVPAFYDHPAFVEAIAQIGEPVLASFKPDHVLFSFHGLPERHLRRGDPAGVCLASRDCCNSIDSRNRNCYRAQCFATARAVSAQLDLPEATTTVTFQSRLGSRAEWIKPYTDETLPKLAEAGVKRLAVFCPAFVADCLETTEEIGMQADETFRAAGGEALQLIPSLNAHPAWVQAVVELSGLAGAGAAP